jgi:hypothetical protein
MPELELTERQQTALIIKQYIEQNGVDETALEDMLGLCYQAEEAGEVDVDFEHRDWWMGMCKYIRTKAMYKNIETSETVYGQYYEKFLLFESKYLFLSFILYMEKNRPYEKRFYEPRRMTLHVVVQDLQDLEDGKYTFYGLSMPPRVGKSTICIFFLAWVMCKRPDSHSAMGGHSGILAKGFYKELINLVTSEEYCFAELYERMNPGLTMLRDKSADEFTITLGHSDRFATVTCRGIDGTWTGAVDISGIGGYLYVDDLIRDREHSLSPTRMENTFQEMLNKMFDRRNDGSKVLMVGTLWSVLDPLERMRLQYGDRPDYLFRRIPALDPITDESNFAYEYNGFSTRYYREMREQLDKPEWMAKYQQMPFVREGLLFPADELRYFNGILPEGDSRIVAVVDVAFGGGDSLSMPIGREYENGDVYIFDWVFSKGAKEITIPRVVGKIIANEIRVMRFEGNAGGDMYCQYVDDELSNQGWKCSCTAKRAPNNMDKMAKINAYAGDIKRNFIFLDEHRRTSEEKAEDKRLGITRYERSAEYEDAMQEVCMFVTVGKNTHDDAVDSLTQLAMFVENPYTTKTTITRGGRW